MIRDMLDPDLKKALEDRLEGFELVEFLQLPTSLVIDVFEDEILDNLLEILEFAGIEPVEIANDND